MIHFFNLFHWAGGSITETQSHLEYGKRVSYLNDSEVAKLDLVLEGIHKDINKIIVTLKNSRP